jgi:hypothetical protein
VSPWPKNPLLRALAFIWTLPLWPVGLALAVYVRLWGGSWRWFNGVLVVNAEGPLADRMLKSGWHGCAFMPTIISWARWNPILWHHEREHIRQGVLLGPLQPLVYGLLWLGYGYRRHPLEVHARAVARGEGEK